MVLSVPRWGGDVAGIFGKLIRLAVVDYPLGLPLAVQELDFVREGMKRQDKRKMQDFELK